MFRKGYTGEIGTNWIYAMITAADKNGGGGREGDESPIC